MTQRLMIGGRIGLAVGVLVACGGGGAVRAQQMPPLNTPPAAPLRLGPVYVTPRFELRDVGTDSNVFNDERELSDFTATLGTGVAVVVLTGPARFTATTDTGYVWYETFAEERAINNHLSGVAEVFFDRLHPWVRAELARTRERAGFEIDARARRSEPVWRGGLDIRVGSRTTLALEASRRQMDFSAAETFRGVNLSEALDNTATTVSGAFRMELTPLTTMIVRADLQQDRFETAVIRDADSSRVTLGFELAPDALLAGDAAIGFREFDPRFGAVPSFRGIVGRAGLTYTLLESTRLGLIFERDTQFSFETDRPYYLHTGATATVTQRVAGPFDVTASFGRQRLDYRQVGGAGPANRDDTVTTYGGGIGYRVGAVRIGVNGERARRRSTLEADRRYDRTRYFASVTYAL